MAVLTMDQKQMALRLRGQGLSFSAIARQVGCSKPMVIHMVRDGKSLRAPSDTWVPRPGRVTVIEREQILLGLAKEESFAAIGRTLGRACSTISREVEKNGGRDGYRAWHAHERARSKSRRPKPFRLSNGPLTQEVSRRLMELWSPQEISKRLRLDFPDDPKMRVSHETIYRSLFVQGRGELRRELARCLRFGRTKRRHNGQAAGHKKFSGMVMISERPPEAADRAVPGHWEGDLILGAKNLSAVGTLVERSTRLVLLLHLDGDRSALNVEKVMRRTIMRLPKLMRRSVTWDQGSEMAAHEGFTIATGIPIYFCDPHSPWQRGSNENTNGLLRQYLPKGTDLSLVTEKELQDIQDSLNNRPRKTLGYLTPYEVYAQAVALTA